MTEGGKNMSIIPYATNCPSMVTPILTHIHLGRTGSASTLLCPDLAVNANQFI